MLANEYCVYQDCEIIPLPLPNKNYKSAEIWLAVDNDDKKWRFGAACTKRDSGHGNPPFKNGKKYDTRDGALAAGLRDMADRHPDMKAVLIKSEFAMLLLGEEQLALF